MSARVAHQARMPNCSGLPDRTTLRHGLDKLHRSAGTKLFRSSRPDYIETSGRIFRQIVSNQLFRSSRPDYIETKHAKRMK